MRIEKLEIDNILSFSGKQIVDFGKNPLNAARLFVVTGGSGVSLAPFLDAICIALYGKTYTDSQNDNTAHAEDYPQGYLSQKAVKGFVRLQFSLETGDVYEARWQCQQGKSASGMEVSRVLRQLSPVSRQWRGDERVQESIDVLVGLTYSQFVSTAILSPRRWAHFLLAAPEEKNLLLEKLTGTEIYGQMSRRVFMHRMEIRKGYEKIISMLEGISKNRLSDDKLREYQEMFLLEKGKREKAVIAAKEVDRCLEWCKKYSSAKSHQEELKQVQLQAQNAYNALHEQKSQLDRFDKLQPFQSLYDAINGKKKEMEYYRSEITDLRRSLRENKQDYDSSAATLKKHRENLELCKTEYTNTLPLINRVYSCEGEIKVYTEKLNVLQEETDRLNEQKDALLLDLKAKEQELDNSLKKQQQLNYDLQAISMHRPMIEKMDDVKADIVKLHDLYLDNQKNSQKLQDIQRDMLADKRSRVNLKSNQNELQSRMTSLKADLSIHIQANLGLTSADLQQEIINCSGLQKDSRHARDLWMNIAGNYERQDKLTNEIRSITAELMKLEKEYPHISQVMYERKKQLETAQKVLLLAQHKQLLDMRKQLNEGSPCPVCGGTHHPYYAQATEDLVNNFTQDKEEAEAAYKNSVEAYDEARDQKLSMRLLLEEKGKILEQLKLQTSEMLSRWEAFLHLDPSFKNTSASVNHTNRITLLTHMLDHSTRELENSKRRIAEYNYHQASLNKINKAIQELTTELAAEKKKHTDVEAEDHVLETFLHETEERIKNNDKKIAVLFSRLEPNVTIPLWKEKYKSSYDDFVREMASIQSDWRNLQKQMSEVDAQVYRLRADVSSVQRVSEIIHNQIADNTREIKLLAEKIRVTRSEMTQQFSEKSATDVEKSYLDRILAARVDVNEAMDKYLENKRIHDGIESNIAMLQQQQSKAEQELHELSSELDFQIVRSDNENTPIQYFELEKIFTDKRDWNLLRAEIDAKKACLERANADMERADMKILHIIQSEDRPLEEFLGNELEFQERRRVLSSEIETAEKNMAQIQFLLDKHQDSIEKLSSYEADKVHLGSELDRWDKLCELMGSPDGSKFRQIAQREVFAVLLKSANAQLRRINSRYYLHALPGTLDIGVIDRDMLDQQRDVDTLSSGEIFVVCLGMALGLSAIQDEHSRKGSMFIDGGMDDLDDDAVSVALDAIVHYQRMSGNSIGILSTSKYLNERVCPHIEVSQDSLGRKQAKVL